MTHIDIQQRVPVSTSFPKGAQCARTEKQAREDRAKNLSIWEVILKGAEPRMGAK